MIKKTLRLVIDILGLGGFYRHNIRPYIKKDNRAIFIQTPHDFLGNADRILAPEVEQKIKHFLDEKFVSSAGKIPPSISDLKVDNNLRQAPHALFVMQQYINGDPKQIESDFIFHLIRSSKSAGLLSKSFYSDHCTYTIKDKNLSQQHLNELRTLIITKAPDLVVFDGNFIGSVEGINSHWWAKLKEEKPFKLVTIIADCNSRQPNYLAYWREVSDLSIIFNRQSEYGRSFSQPNRLLYAPTLPFSEDSMDWKAFKETERDISFCCIGSDSRNRREFCSLIRRTKLHAKIVLHTRFKKQAVSMGDYIKIFCRSKIVFNTGYTNPNESIITGRTVEAILCKALLLEEDGVSLSDYFIPWRHFIPVFNAHEVAIFAQFFAKNESYRQRIVEEAYSMHQLHYSSKIFWNAVLSKLKL